MGMSKHGPPQTCDITSEFFRIRKIFRGILSRDSHHALTVLEVIRRAVVKLDDRLVGDDIRDGEFDVIRDSVANVEVVRVTTCYQG